jgi:hypothetical protein
MLKIITSKETGKIAVITRKNVKYLKNKINELAMNNKNKNIRDLYRGIN